MIQRWHYDHPEMPDAMTVTGVTDGRLSMHSFDCRGVHRVYAAGLDGRRWQLAGRVGEYDSRFTGTLSEDGNTIAGLFELSTDGSTWADDLSITFRRTA